ncbi:hypothetical protein [Micromonospora sp. NBC_01740]|uniref:hypothetical protein n=1 Tax=unclassified Micromonospora TaxID=2617518 RepID=UPI002E10BC2B|nr:hypothetical protein OG989_24900 [Micromonospora sp. NBC_01740]
MQAYRITASVLVRLAESDVARLAADRAVAVTPRWRAAARRRPAWRTWPPWRA